MEAKLLIEDPCYRLDAHSFMLYVYTCSRIIDVMARIKLTLTLDETVIERIKIQAVKERRSVSKITEELFREYLERLKK